MNKIKAQTTSVEMKEKKKEVERQRKIVKGKFYPYLLSNTESIEDAKNLLTMAFTVLEEVFQKKVQDYQTKLSQEKLSSLDILSVMKNNKDTRRERDLIDMFKDETIGTADALLTGMKREIEGRMREEGTKRKLDTVESDFNKIDSNDNIIHE